MEEGRDILLSVQVLEWWKVCTTVFFGAIPVGGIREPDELDTNPKGIVGEQSRQTR